VVVDPSQQRRVATDVVALLADRGRRAHHHVDGLAEVDLGVALDQGPQRSRGQIVGAHGPERALAGSADRGPDGIDDHCLWHPGGHAVSQRRRSCHPAFR